MSKPKYAQIRDGNHSEIVEYLKAFGIFAKDISSTGNGLSDIFTHAKETVFIEIKLDKDGRFKRNQLEFMSTFPGYCGVARSQDEALHLAKYPDDYALSHSEKWKLQQWLINKPKQQTLAVNEFLKVIGRENK